MQIHELDNYNGSLDANAYLAIDNGSDTGKISTPRLLTDVNNNIADLDSSLNARIDNIIAGGTAPSEAEIIDARLGAASLGNVQYASLGDAIRGQATELEDEISLLTGELNIDSMTVNKWNPDEEATDKVVSNANATLGQLVNEAGYSTSGYIAAVKDNVLRWDYSTGVVSEGATLARGTNVFRIAEYDINKGCLLVSANWAALPYTVQNASTAFVRVSVPTRPTNSIIFGDASTAQITYVADKSGSITIENLERSVGRMDILVSSNKWDPDEALTGQISKSNLNYGGVISAAGYLVSGLIPVNQGQKIMYYYTNDPTIVSIGTAFYRIAEYDKDGNCLLVSTDWEGAPYTVQNANAKYIRANIYGTYSYIMLTINDNKIYQKPFIPFVPNYNSIAELMENVETETEVILPSAIYGVTGQEINVYKENLILNNRLRNLSYIHTRLSNDAIQDDFRTIWNPNVNSITETNREWDICLYGLTQPIMKTIKECAVPKNTGNSSIKVLVIGDSKVDGGFLTFHLYHNFDDDDMSITLLGTKYDWATWNRNEGWGGKTAKWFCTDAGSPLSKYGACDFSNYLTVNAIDTPDFVFINLGTNDCASMSGDSDTFLTEFVTYIEEMITSIHSVDSNINVVVGMTEGCSTVQDTNNASFLSWDLNQKISRLHKATIAAFDNRQNENIYVCPMYMGMDLTQDYNMTEVPLSKRDGDMNSGAGDGKTRMQITDPIHQSEVGYWKNADYMYAILKYIVAKSL